MIHQEQNIVEPVLDFIHGVSVLYFKNCETLEGFRDQNTDQIQNWLSEKTDAEPLFLVHDLDTLRVGLLLQIDSENLKKNNVLMVMKNQSVIDSDASIESQFNIIMLPQDSQFDTLKTLVDVGLYQIFDKVVINRSRDSKTVPDSLLNTKRKIKDLSLSLQNLDKEIQLPNIEESIHPLVKQLVIDGATAHNVDEHLPPDQLNDSSFLNALQKTSNSWIKAVHSISRLENNLADGTALDEVNFWRNYCTALRELEKMLSCKEVEITISILVSAKRFYSSTSFINDTGLSNMIAETQSFSTFLDGLAIQNISSATSMPDLNIAIEKFAYEIRKLKITQYPLEKAIKLIEKVSDDICIKAEELLPNLLLMDYEQFLNIKENALMVLDNFEDKLKDFTLMIRELMRKKAAKFIFLKLNCSTEGLKQRISNVSTFREQHHIFLEALTAVDNRPLRERTERIYDKVKPVNVLKADVVSWVHLQKNYSQQISLIEDELIAILRKELENCHSSKEMFSIFERYELLTKRIRVLNAVREYQHQLLDNVKTDTNFIRDSISSWTPTNAAEEQFDIQSIIHDIVWRKKLLKKLKLITSKLTVILGSDWDKTTIGSQISKECTSIQSSLSTDKIYESWIWNAQNTEFSLDQSVFKVILSKTDYELKVNFNFSSGSLFKALRNLIWQGYDIPSDIVRKSRITRNTYPYAAIIAEKLQTFFLVVDGVKQLSYTTPLLRNSVNDVWKSLSTLITESWETVPIDTIVDGSNISGDLARFEEGVDRLLRDYENFSTMEFQVKEYYLNLDNFSLDEASGNITEQLQYIVDKFRLEVTEDNVLFVSMLNHRLRMTLIQKFKDFIQSLILEPIEQRITFSNGVFQFEPSFCAVKSSWINRLSFIVNKIQNQPKLIVCSFGTALNTATFTDILSDIQPTIVEYMDSIDRFHASLGKILSKWKTTEYLWTLTEEQFVANVSTDIEICLAFMTNIYEQRKTMNYISFNTEAESSINVKVSEEQALLQCCTKFDQWHAFGLRHLILLYTQLSTDLHHRLTMDRKFFEDLPLSFSSLKSITDMIIHLDNVGSKSEVTYKQFAILKSSQRLFLQVRANLPADFIYCEQLKTDLDSLKEICMKRENLVTENRDIIATKLDSEIERLKLVSESLIQGWKNRKPVGSETDPAEALAVIASFEDSVNATKNQIHDLLKTAKVLLIPTTVNFHLQDILTEIQNYKAMWLSVGTLWNSMQDILNQTWNSVAIGDVKQRLQTLYDDTNNLPSNVLQYSVFQNLLQSINSVLSAMKTLQNLKSAPLKAKHWCCIFQKFGSWEPPATTLDSQSFSLIDVLSLSVSVNKNELNNIVNQAKDEEVLASTLKDMRDKWKEVTIDSFIHQSGHKLIKNWSSLFTTATDDINTLLSMKNSQFYKIFDQEIYELETKLTDFSEILMTGLEIQKQWCYLYGVLNEGSSLKALLSVEAAQFSVLTSDLNILFNTLQTAKIAMDVLYHSDYINALRSLLESLTRVRKSLNDFLESQRELFPRFYFIGNEDLLQLIGFSTDFEFLSNQMRKMFGSVGRLEIVDNSITAIYSIEGERLSLINDVKVTPQTPAYQWLSSLEKELKHTLSTLATACYRKYSLKDLDSLIDEYPFQVIWLCMLVNWTERAQTMRPDDLGNLIDDFTDAIKRLSIRKRAADGMCRHTLIDSLLSEMFGLKEMTLLLKTAENKEVTWNETQKFYIDTSAAALETVKIVQTGIEVQYGFEYVGVPETLVQTPTLQTFFATMLHALSNNLGGSPFGPAGTGKTESVKYLAKRLGRFVLVFNCDDTFDYRSMARILFGIAQVGAWGCFDEFNRLKADLLSAVSSQIEAIQSSMISEDRKLSILERNGLIHRNTAIFITMNLGYAGRSQLPGNLKRMFREFTMSAPQTVIIIETLLNTMGFEDAKGTSSQLVSFFAELESKTSCQSHYDFGLRAIKSVIRNCNLQLMQNEGIPNHAILLRSIWNIITPKLLEEDEAIFETAWNRFFPKNFSSVKGHDLEEIVIEFCEKQHITFNDSFYKKCQQLYEVQKSQQGVILVGEAGCGKTTVLNATMEMVQNTTKKSNVIYTIDSKALKKEQLYGNLDPVTFEWQDGLFTTILREINEDYLDEYENANIWIIFDSDLDPIYAETLNSALDDNKVFTLPNGERLDIPHHLHIVFEVEDLTFATPATISRCGMLWFNKNIISPHNLFCSTYNRLFNSTPNYGPSATKLKDSMLEISDSIFCPEDFELILRKSADLNHILDFDINRIAKVYSYLICNPYVSYFNDLSKMTSSIFKLFILRHSALSIVWAFAGDCPVDDKIVFSSFIQSHLQSHGLPPVNGLILDYEVSPVSAELLPHKRNLQNTELEAHQVLLPDLIIPTVDTYRHEAILFTLLKQHQPLILCGPPGSGKTMTLQSALKQSEDHMLVGMNFSKDTTVESFLKTIEQHTTYKSTAEGLIMQPVSFGKQLVFFCDEINLPKPDKYGSQPIILFLRQLLEKNGFWSPKDNKWVSLKNIQIVAACNPSSDPGRSKMTKRFTRHAAIIMVDYPSKESLLHIYQTFFRSVLKASSIKKDYADNLARVSVEIYFECKKQFTVQQQYHYIFSPRELTRWVRGVYHAISSSEMVDLSQLIKIWAYESRRIFSDRLVSEEERHLFDKFLVDAVSSEFPLQNITDIIQPSFVFCNWLNMKYEQSDLNKIRSFVSERLKTFCEEVLSYDIILHNEMLYAMLNVDRILKQVQGHGILVAPSGSGKTTITRFVAWLNGIDVRIPLVHRNYNLLEFDAFLRHVLVESGVENKKVCMILDESNMVEASFVERLNTLLANSDIPGLFQAEDYDSLIAKIRGSPFLPRTVLDTEQSMYDWFTEQISKNLHVVIKISDPKKSNSANIMTSPALFNRCVLTWMGTWKNGTLIQVAKHFIDKIPLDQTMEASDTVGQISSDSLRSKVTEIFYSVFKDYYSSYDVPYPSPALFLDSLKVLRIEYTKKLTESDNNQRFIRNGLIKLKESVIMVKKLNKEMESKKNILQEKKIEARKTLDQMLHDQNESERKQEASIEIQKILNLQEQEISKRRDVVMNDLAKAEPAILEAQRGVKNIKKQQLTELRTMINPPEAVKITLEAVCVLLGFQIGTWKDIQQTIRKDDFIARIVTFETETMLSQELKHYIQTHYLNRSNFKHENVLRASQACGPLYLWIEAQILFSDALTRVGPLQRDLQILEDEILRTRAKVLAADEMINELQEQIEKSKELYSKIIRDIEVLKSEMSLVESKVSKSTTLLESLNSEKERWTFETRQFTEVKKNLLGDTILSSLYSAYCFTHDFKTRAELVGKWKMILATSDIAYDQSFNNLAKRVSLENKSFWIENGLSEDEFAIETFSAVVSPTIEKYPLILDPEGNILDVLYAVYGSKLVMTSFLDQNFSKSLENTLRFGGVLLIQDGEFFDPFVTKVLKQEFQNVGGRRSIELGDSIRDLDVSNDFRMIIYSRDKSWRVPNYVLTKTKAFNFTITKGNLESQTLQDILTNELPTIQNERKLLLEKDSTCQLRLRELGNRLLGLLNSSESNILENEELLKTLENLKVEAGTMSTEISKIQSLVLEQESAITEFSPISTIAVQIFELLEWVRIKKHWFYDVEVNEFLTVFRYVLENSDELVNSKPNKPNKILSVLIRLMFCAFGPMFLENDRLSFAARLMELQMYSMESTRTVEEWKMIRSNIDLLRTQPQLSERFTEFKEGLLVGDAKDGLSQMILTIMKEQPWEISDFLSKNTRSNILLVGADKGVDGSFMIKKLAEQLQKKITTIAMGSSESCKIAEETLNDCVEVGGWVLLQNIQMSLTWCNEILPKYLKQIISNSNENFKLFMTCSLQDSIHPSSQLLQYSTKIAYEGESGVLYKVKKFWELIIQKKPVEGTGLYLKHLVCWIHSLLLERVKITTKDVEYHDLDLELAINAVENCVDNEAIDWPKLRFIVGKLIYCNRLDKRDELYQWIMNLTASIMHEGSFKANSNIIGDVGSPSSKHSMHGITEWLNNLPWTIEHKDIWLSVPKGNLERISFMQAVSCMSDLVAMDAGSDQLDVK